MIILHISGCEVMNAEELGRKLRNIRLARGLSQQSVADLLGLSRPAITQMELGNRSVSTLEVSKLLDIYMVSATEFFSDKDSVPEEDVYLSLHEVAPDLEANQSVKKQVTLCEYFLREGVFFKRLLGKETQPLAPIYAFPVPKNTLQAAKQAEQVADFERSRLGLGSEPIADISDSIYFQGIWASRIDLPADVSGLFFNHPNIGLVILANASFSKDKIRFFLRTRICPCLI